jgi:hypothetical protein
MQQLPNRHQLATYWLTLPPNQLATAYTGQIGDAHRTLLNNEIQEEPLDNDTERYFAQQLLTYVAKGFEQPLALQYLIAAMLYYRADQLPLQYQQAVIPEWFVEELLRFMLKSPPLFQQPGEAQRYYDYTQNWNSFLYTFIFAQPDADLQRQVARVFANTANFVQIYFNTENLCDIFTKRGDILELVLRQYRDTPYRLFIF